jgi:uncharacterized protein (TIGR02391 family)
MALSDLPDDPDVLLALAAEELGFALLQLARKHMQSGTFHPNSISYPAASHSLQPPGPSKFRPDQERQVQRALAEAWNWLRVQGLIVPDSGANGQNGWMLLSRRAERMLSEAEFDGFRQAAAFPKQLLHPSIAEKVWVSLARGENAEAVFHAFRAVEEAVRHAAGYDLTDVGVPLMRKAFDPQNGRLTKSTDPEAEREALAHLFAGAIGSYKNPHSHRTVTVADPLEAQEIVLLASHLLRIVDSRRPAP